MKVLNRYILKELSIPFILTLFVLTITSLLSKSTKLVEMGLVDGVDLKIILDFIVSILPSFLIYIIPISFLFSIIFAFSRLSEDGELTAVKASGINLYKLSVPVFIMAFVIFIISLFVTVYLFPLGNNLLKETLYKVARTKTISGINERVFNSDFGGLTLYAEEVFPRRNTIKNVFISDHRKKGRTTIIFAKKGQFISGRDSSTIFLKLIKGTIHRLFYLSSNYQLIKFDIYDLDLPLDNNLSTGHYEDKTNRELYLNELRSRIEKKKKEKGNPSPYIIDMHKRFSLPVSILVFVLVGIPIGMQRIRTAKFTSFSISLAIVLIYYLLSTVFESFGENGLINPFLAVWGSDIILGGLGFYLFVTAGRDLPLNTGVISLLRWKNRYSRHYEKTP